MEAQHGPRDRDSETPAASEQLQELAWLVGDWVDDSSDADNSVTVKWTENKTFLTYAFKVSAPGSDDLEGTQIIGWDPAAGTIRSWMFDSDGGFGEGAWSKHGDTWVVKFGEGLVRRPQGLGNQRLQAGGRQHIRAWKSIGRKLDGQFLPNIEVKMVRKTAADGGRKRQGGREDRKEVDAEKVNSSLGQCCGDFATSGGGRVRPWRAQEAEAEAVRSRRRRRRECARGGGGGARPSPAMNRSPSMSRAVAVGRKPRGTRPSAGANRPARRRAGHVRRQARDKGWRAIGRASFPLHHGPVRAGPPPAGRQQSRGRGSRGVSVSAIVQSAKPRSSQRLPQHAPAGNSATGTSPPTASQLPSNGQGPRTITTPGGSTITVAGGGGWHTTQGGATVGGAAGRSRFEGAGGNTAVKGSGVAGASKGDSTVVAGGSRSGIQTAAAQRSGPCQRFRWRKRRWRWREPSRRITASASMVGYPCPTRAPVVRPFPC